MNTTKFESFVDRYTNDPKKALTLGLMILAVIIAFAIVWRVAGNKIKMLIQQAQNQLQQNQAMSTIESRYPNQTKTYTAFEYTTFADRLLVAMKGAGTDEESIFAVFRQMNNDLDVYALIDAFGTQKAAWPSSWSGTLPAWITDELSQSDITKLNQILNSKGISYRF